MNGYELARVLRADARCSGMRLVAFSGYGLEEDRRRALEAGFDLHLVKPASLQSLQAALHSLFGGRSRAPGEGAAAVAQPEGHARTTISPLS